jgi:hypothetical protein
MAPGGSGDPYAGLNTHQREELAVLYRLGYPRGDEVMIGAPMGQMWQWTAEADSIYRQDPSYFENFWTKPGYVGHDSPELLASDRIESTVTVTRVMSAQEVLDDPAMAGPEFVTFRSLVAGVAGGTGMGMTKPSVIEVKGLGAGYRLGTGVRVVSGLGAGREFYAMASARDFFFCDGSAKNSAVLFSDVAPGDKVHIDNSRWLAYGCFVRHHIMDDPQFDSLRVDGQPIYPHHPLADLSSFMGVCYSGQFSGKLMWVRHTHDASLWPPQGVIYADAVRAAQGETGLRERFRLRWTDNAEHVPPAMLPSALGRSANTVLIDYLPAIEQSLLDLIDWVERGVEPTGSNYSYWDGKVTLPATAAERGGIQAVVSVTANGASLAKVKAGEPVTLTVSAEMPPGSGSIIDVKWDFDGSGAFPLTDPTVDGRASKVTLTKSHAYDKPGTYFATALVHSHRDGDVKATSRRVPNLAQARVVVT